MLLGLLVPFLAFGQSETGGGVPGEVLWRRTGLFFLGNAIAWSPDGRYLASGGGDSTVRFWEAGSGELLAEFPDQRAVMVHEVAWSESGLLASGGGGITVWW